MCWKDVSASPTPKELLRTVTLRMCGGLSKNEGSTCISMIGYPFPRKEQFSIIAWDDFHLHHTRQCACVHARACVCTTHKHTQREREREALADNDRHENVSM